jgi:hypothetical protein
VTDALLGRKFYIVIVTFTPTGIPLPYPLCRKPGGPRAGLNAMEKRKSVSLAGNGTQGFSVAVYIYINKKENL